MSNKLSVEQRRFIDDLATLLVPWGMPVTASRLYGFLQIMTEPVALDAIAANLEVSRSNAHAAARILEEAGSARRLSERGTKRALYVVADDPGAPLHRQTELLGKMSELIRSRKDTVSEGPAEARLARLAAFHGALRAAMEQVIQMPFNLAKACPPTGIQNDRCMTGTGA